MTPAEFQDVALARTRGVLVDLDETFQLLLAALLVGGNVLVEGVPGTAKTLMARVLAHLFSAGDAPTSPAGQGGQDSQDAPSVFKRIQFTPDLMPSDIVGTNVFNGATA